MFGYLEWGNQNHVFLFQAEADIIHKLLTYIAIASLGILLLFMFIIGTLSLNLKISLSVIPFLVLAIYAVISHKKKPLID